jgi:hypothetical protein
MKISEKIEELNTKFEKLDGKVLFLLSITSIEFILILILYLK